MNFTMIKWLFLKIFVRIYINYTWQKCNVANEWKVISSEKDDFTSNKLQVYPNQFSLDVSSSLDNCLCFQEIHKHQCFDISKQLNKRWAKWFVILFWSSLLYSMVACLNSNILCSSNWVTVVVFWSFHVIMVCLLIINILIWRMSFLLLKCIHKKLKNHEFALKFAHI